MPEIEIPPGIVKSRSDAAAVGRWIDAQWMRFVPDPEKIRGWELLYPVAMRGIPRAAFTWQGPSGFELRAYGTESKLYVGFLGDQPVDITPFRITDAALATDPFAVTDGSTTVIVTDTAHAAKLNDTVVFSGATAGGGITIVGSYVITSIIGVNSYTIEHSTPATSTDATTGGASVLSSYEINVGATNDATALGYGVGPYGAGPYGVARTASDVTIEARFWSLDNYGDWLITAYRAGSRVYTYDHGIDTRAQILANSPTDVRFVFVTDERFVMALCADMTLKWPDVDVPTIWTPAEDNTANIRRLGYGNQLIAGGSTAGGVSLIWTDIGVYIAQYVGGRFIYDTRVGGVDCGLIGPDAFCFIHGSAYWFGPKAMHMWNGAVQPIPNSGDVDTWAYENLTPSARSKTVCFSNELFNEAWWIFAAEGNNEPSHYILLNLDRYDWSWGELERVGATTSARKGILLTDEDGYVYVHEVGLNGNGSPIAISLKSGLWRASEAKRKVDLTGFALDAARHVGAVDVRFFGKDRTDSVTEDSETISISPGDGMVDPRIEGRYFGLEISQEVLDGDLKLGVPTAEISDAGERR